MQRLLVFAGAPATERIFGVPGAVWHGLLVLAALSLFAWILGRRLQLLQAAQPDPRLDRPLERWKRLLLVGFGQARQPRYPLAGWLHIVVFAGFLVLLLRSLTLLGQGFSAAFVLPGLGGAGGPVYGAIKDWTGLAVLVAIGVLAVRRAFFRPARYHDRTSPRSHGGEAYVILGLIALLLLADALYDGTANVPDTGALPLASAAKALTAGVAAGTRSTLHLGAFWVHNLALLAFLCYLPLSKHFHVITALPNTFLSKLPPRGRVKPARHGVSDLDVLDHLGTGCLEDATWKHLLDAYSCTDCGRCSDQCPAYATGTPLSPRMLSIKTRDAAYAWWPVFGKTTPQDARPAFVGEIVRDEEIWACTTCGACEAICPVLIEYVDKIVDMRRHLVEEGRVPKTLQKALADVEKRQNPYGKMPRKRGEWVREEGAEDAARIVAEGERCQDLFFTDSAAAYDPRIQRIARAFARVLGRAGRDVGTMGADEADSGHEARRMGEEGLYEILRDQNREALEARTCERIVTTDPHAMNALVNDYGVAQPVVHHSQALDRLIADGSLVPRPSADDRTYVFHDPCYLGRHGGEFDAPRRVLAAIPGLRLAEMTASRERSFCCGGGSLYLFHEGTSERRMGEVRLEMAEAAGAQVVVTACPFCLINLEDAVKTSGREGRVEVLDLAEVVARSLGDET
jgi:Fe-S oxidoreductase